MQNKNLMPNATNETKKQMLVLRIKLSDDDRLDLIVNLVGLCRMDLIDMNVNGYVEILLMWMK